MPDIDTPTLQERLDEAKQLGKKDAAAAVKLVEKLLLQELSFGAPGVAGMLFCFFLDECEHKKEADERQSKKKSVDTSDVVTVRAKENAVTLLGDLYAKLQYVVPFFPLRLFFMWL